MPNLGTSVCQDRIDVFAGCAVLRRQLGYTEWIEPGVNLAPESWIETERRVSMSTNQIIRPPAKPVHQVLEGMPPR